MPRITIEIAGRALARANAPTVRALALAIATTTATVVPVAAMGAQDPGSPPSAGALGAAAQPSGGLTPSAPDAAMLTQCQTAGAAAERTATFSGEMIVIPGAVRMSMRVELLERGEGEKHFHAVAAPGLGAWRTADSGVSVFEYVKQVTNLSAPASYRALFTFRWQGSRGHTLKREEKRTRSCSVPGPAPAPPAGPPPSAPSPTVE